ncbi:tRNA lysidine(34) synthetase TilS [Flavobacteriaceae bacterium KMM 6897]|nr:tRNA lysidine(34) synthetase TilS [Flavobacteriaceae bacterium KMM 6897]MEB8345275.1 tRNA lysidine(34) synthetase TilS [Flavobacteriaceae bacterium KMM 6898]
MLEEFKNHINTSFPHLREGKFLLACSGGLDSVVLTHLCHSTKVDFALAHCNFGLRGEASDGDEAFVKNLAKDLDKEFFVIHFHTVEYMNKNKVSLQMAARELRYEWFQSLMEQKGWKTLVTAHHADDNLETFLINLSRGTGIDGLTGIPEKTTGISRPLLKYSRVKIEAYANEQKLEWREDSSNQETKYLRNKIRHQIVPLLKELHPTFLNNFNQTQHYLRQTSGIAEDHIKQLKEKLFIRDMDVIKIPIAEVLKLKPIEGYMYALLHDYGFKEWNDVMSLLTAMGGKEIRSKTHRLLKHREYLLLEEISIPESLEYGIYETDDRIEEPLQMSLDMVDRIEETGNAILYVDKETLKYPMTVRKWRKGDYFYPFGMSGRKKVSKFFKDVRMDQISKEKQWLLCSEDNVVWIMGKRGDERFKVTPKTKQILKIRIQE